MRSGRILLAAVIVLAGLLTGCSTHATSTGGSSVVVPDVAGQAGNDAKHAIQAAGLVVKWDAGSDLVILSSNWTVQSQDPAAGASAARGSIVTLTVTKIASTPAAQTATTSGITIGQADVVCDDYAKAQFPYGYNPAHILGVIVSEPVGADWHMEYTAKVKNVFNAEKTVAVDCIVSGDATTATVTSFVAG